MKIIAAVNLFWMVLLAPSNIFSQSYNRQLPFIYMSGGYTLHSYAHEGTFGYLGVQVPYLSSMLSAPTINAGIEWPKAHSTLELSYYVSLVPSTQPDVDIGYAKRSWSAMYGYSIRSFLMGVHYQSNNNRHLTSLFSEQRRYSFENGIGFTFRVKHKDFDIDLRKELMFGFGEYVFYTASLYEHWAFRVSRRFLGEEKIHSKRKNGLFFDLGGTLSLNSLHERFKAQSKVKLMPAFGIGYHFESLNSDIYARRESWYNLEADNFNFGFNTHTSHLGFSYYILQDLHVGLHHSWLLDRSYLLLSALDNGVSKNTVASKYENFAVGFNASFWINQNFAINFDLDLFYKTRSNLTRGINDESFRLGLLYRIY